jgi:hypothetical protein
MSDGYNVGVVSAKTRPRKGLVMALTYCLNQWRIQRWQKGTRYYICRVEQDLFGTWLMCSEWGGLHVGRRRIREEVYPTYEAAIARFDEVNQRRQRRGYTAINW